MIEKARRLVGNNNIFNKFLKIIKDNKNNDKKIYVGVYTRNFDNEIIGRVLNLNKNYNEERYEKYKSDLKKFLDGYNMETDDKYRLILSKIFDNPNENKFGSTIKDIDFDYIFNVDFSGDGFIFFSNMGQTTKIEERDDCFLFWRNYDI